MVRSRRGCGRTRRRSSRPSLEIPTIRPVRAHSGCGLHRPRSGDDDALVRRVPRCLNSRIGAARHRTSPCTAERRSRGGASAAGSAPGSARLVIYPWRGCVSPGFPAPAVRPDQTVRAPGPRPVTYLPEWRRAGRLSARTTPTGKWHEGRPSPAPRPTSGAVAGRRRVTPTSPTSTRPTGASRLRRPGAVPHRPGVGLRNSGRGTVRPP
jgi:hypothetical protein